MDKINYTDNAITAIDKMNGNFSQSANSLSDDVFIGNLAIDGSWVKQSCNVCPVANGVTYRFSLPENYVAKIKYGIAAKPSVDTDVVGDSGEIVLPFEADTMRFFFAKHIDGDIVGVSIDEVTELISNGNIKVYITDKDVISRNLSKENVFAAIKRVSTAAQLLTSDINKAPLIAHISDLHGDIQRAYNFMKWCSYYGIDDCVVSGDSVLYDATDGLDYVFAAAIDCNTHVDLAIGNHEIKSISTDTTYSKYLSRYAEMLDYKKSQSAITDKGYYYHDIAGKKIRVIVLDVYDGNVYGFMGKVGRISQDQFDFFISALKDTPSDYGIIVVLHSYERQIVTPEEYKKFTYGSLSSGGGAYVDEDRPISRIIDAFIGRSIYDKTIEQTYNGTTETINIHADFSAGVNEGVEFLFYLSGHIHHDRVGYYSGTQHKQLNLIVTSANAIVTSRSGYAFGDEDDLARFGKGVTQDAFNVYSIDRDRKEVRIMRVGADLTYDFEPRDYMVIPYAD